jgi:hypothetical protein
MQVFLLYFVLHIRVPINEEQLDCILRFVYITELYAGYMELRCEIWFQYH